MKKYDSPEVTEYGTVTDITEDDGNNKEGEGDDEFSEIVPLTGTVF